MEKNTKKNEKNINKKKAVETVYSKSPSSRATVNHHGRLLPAKLLQRSPAPTPAKKTKAGPY